LIALNIPTYCRQTDSYIINYYFVSSSQAPNPVGGGLIKVAERQYLANFNDQTTMNLRFSTDQLNIGTCFIQNSPSIAGNFCLINTKLYYSFYTLSPGAPTTCVAPTPPLTIAPPSACPALQAQPTQSAQPALPTGPPIAPIMSVGPVRPVGTVRPDDSLQLKIQ
jgi:hypothetical protein